MNDRPSYPAPSRDKIAPCEADATCVPCSECLKEIESIPALTVHQQEHIYHFCGAACLERWRARKRELQGSGSN